MKCVAVGALFVSLLAGSVAMAGQGYRGNFSADRDNPHSDNRGGRHDDNNRHDGHDRRDPPRQNWDHGRDDPGRNGWDRAPDRHDWNRGRDGGHDWDRRHDWDRGRDWDRPHDWDRHRDWPRYNYAPPRYDYSSPRYDAPPRHDWYRPRFDYGSYHRPYGYYPHSWIRGEYLPRAYYARPYVIYDYDRCGLHRPPYGYHWVRVDTDVVLAAVATGVILDVIYNQFY